MTFLHLNDINESYLQHGKNALWIAWQCTSLLPALLVHAVYPDVFVRTAGNKLDKIEAFRAERERRRTYYSLNDWDW